MLYFILVYLWSWVIVPFTFVILRPFIRLDSHMNCHNFINTVLGVQHQITGEKLFDEGFILSNHRSFMDIFIDAYVSKSVMMGRYLIIFAFPFKNNYLNYTPPQEEQNFKIFQILFCSRTQQE